MMSGYHTSGMEAVVILGDQLFLNPNIFTPQRKLCFMAEDYELCTRFRYHKHKIILFLSSMRHYRDYLKEKLGIAVSYWELSSSTSSLSYEEKLERFVKEKRVSKLVLYEIQDTFFRERILDFAARSSLQVEVLRSPMFLVDAEEFRTYLKLHKKPFMKTFYEEQRRRTGLLMTPSGEPEGGKFSFDSENRRRLPKAEAPPRVVYSADGHHTKQVKALVADFFPNHPGNCESYWIPVTHEGAEQWLLSFLEERFQHFGDYEDAISQKSEFLYHSALSPLLNCGLLTPKMVLEKALRLCPHIPINSREGFLRQILGWREFIRGVYSSYGPEQEGKNFWNHHRTLRECWYQARTGIPPLDDALNKVIRLGYNHHIERLMIVSNIMLLAEVHPKEVYRWFMEMYVDSADWVMVPNVYGMGQWSDGGIFATKPYICGSNYIRKMSNDYDKGSWCDELDGLYWRFILLHSEHFANNPRTRMSVSLAERISADRKTFLLKAALGCQERLTRL